MEKADTPRHLLTAFSEGHNMPKCPKCEESISELKVFCYEQNKYIVYLKEDVQAEDGSWELDWSTSEVVEDTETKREYTCPECETVLFRTLEAVDTFMELEAIRFLSGEAEDEGQGR